MNERRDDDTTRPNREFHFFCLVSTEKDKGKRHNVMLMFQLAISCVVGHESCPAIFRRPMWEYLKHAPGLFCLGEQVPPDPNPNPNPTSNAMEGSVLGCCRLEILNVDWTLIGDWTLVGPARAAVGYCIT